MNTELINDIKSKLEKKLSPSRYEHTMGVAYTAASLAMKYGEDMDLAFLAGLLHDCAKYLTPEKYIDKCNKYNIEISDAEKRQPDLLHAKLGAFLAGYKYGVSDEKIAHAIKYHTTGCADMSCFDMIIYVADYIEPNRNKAPRLDYYRKLAFEDIKRCTYEILEGTIEYVKEKNACIDETTVDAYKALKEEFSK